MRNSGTWGVPAESVAAALAAALAISCAGPVHSEREIEQASRTAAQAGTPVEPPAASPGASPAAQASVSEVRGKVAAIFGQVVREPAGRATRFLTGDFNGDGWQDLAVVVRPAARALDGINSPVASWIVKDVEPPTAPAAQATTSTGTPPMVRVEAADVLLAVIHGYGSAGWHDPQARQTYLLRHATADTMEARPLEGLIALPPGKRFTGDVILQARAGQRSFLFWTGASYRRHVLDAGAASGPGALGR